MTDYPDKDAYTDALIANELREKLNAWTASAVNHGVDSKWANTWLAKLGAPKITSTNEYRMNVPITALLGWRCTATNRAQAAEQFLEHIQAVLSRGSYTDCTINYGEAVYDMKTTEPVTADDVVFYSGPEDTPDTDNPAVGLDELKTGIRQMLKEGVTQQNWGISYAQNALVDMGLATLPPLHARTVSVPVTGTARITIQGFATDDDEAVRAVVAAKLKRLGSVYLQPEEIGDVIQDDEPEY